MFYGILTRNILRRNKWARRARTGSLVLFIVTMFFYFGLGSFMEAWHAKVVKNVFLVLLGYLLYPFYLLSKSFILFFGRWSAVILMVFAVAITFGLVAAIVISLFGKLATRKQKSNAPESTDDMSWVVYFKETDFPRFIRGLNLLFPDDAKLYTEWWKIPLDVENFFQQNQASNISENIGSGSWPKPKRFLIPLETRILERLSDLAIKYHLIESCNYIAVVKDRKELLIGEDTSDTGGVYLSNKIDEELIKKFCTETQCKYKREK